MLLVGQYSTGKTTLIRFSDNFHDDDDDYHHCDYQARALRALGLLLADGAPPWEGGRLFDGSTKSFCGNSCNSGTESRKMVFKVGN